MGYTSNKNKKINTQYFQDIASSYRKSRSTSETVDIISFVEAQWGLNIKLFPVQKFILKAYYGLELDDSNETIIVPDEMNSREIGKFTEQGFMNFLIDTGRTNIREYTPGMPRRELVLNCGRRSSKSSIASFISNYEVYRLEKMGNPQEYFGFPNGQEIAVCTTSTSEETAATLFSIMKNYCLNCSYLKDKVVNRSRDYFTLATENDTANGADPSIYLICGGARSSSIRGHNNIVVIMDEAAFFPVSGDGNGDNLYKALTPSISTFTKVQPDGTRKGEGKIILLSSPYGKSGVFYKKYLESFEFTDSMLMFNMYTAMVNPTVDGSILKDEKRRNPQMFECEYGAKFSDTVSSWMNEETLDKVTDKTLVLNPRQGRGGVEYYMGIDYAGKKDGAAISIVHKENGKIVLDYSDVFYGAQSDVWWDNDKAYEAVNRKFADKDIIPLEGLADEVKRLNSLFPIKYGWFDQFNGYGLAEMLEKRGLTQFEIKSLNAGLNMEMYRLAKELICSELIRIPYSPMLRQEMLSLEENKNGAKTTVEAPQRPGFHDDLTDSFVEACYACHMKSKGIQANAKVLSSGGNGRIASGVGYNSYMMRRARLHGVQDKRGFPL